MAPVEEGNSSQIDGTESAGQRHSPDTDVEVSRKANQQQLERQAKGVKGRFTSELNTVKKLMITYADDYPTDSTQFDSSRVRQLQDAEDIVTVLKRLTDRWENIVTLQDDIKTCICTSTVLEDTQIDKEVEKAEASLEDYTGKHSTFKKEYAEIKDRVNGYIDKMK